jgi:hypothetical protein
MLVLELMTAAFCKAGEKMTGIVGASLVYQRFRTPFFCRTLPSCLATSANKT